MAQLAELRRHYRMKGRPEAARNLTRTMKMAEARIRLGFSVAAPRPYPELKTEGAAWVHAGLYWVQHTTTESITAIAVFYDTADIPGRR